MRGMTFSIPTTARWTRGRTVPIRPFPSLVTSTTEPVSATRKFPPEMPIPAERNFARRCFRAIPTSSGMLSVRGSPRWRSKRREISSRVLWTAGAMMWEGVSPASWRMYSPRSDSTTVTPAPWSASFREISSDAIDFDFTAREIPSSRAIRAAISCAWTASLATWTIAPRFSASAMKRARYVSRWSSTSRLIRDARSRVASNSGKEATAALRWAWNRPVVRPRAPCSVLSRSAFRAFRPNAFALSSISGPPRFGRARVDAVPSKRHPPRRRTALRRSRRGFRRDGSPSPGIRSAKSTR